MKCWLIILALSLPCFGQSWTNILNPTRAMPWTNAGLTATFADGETTPNPWMPPTRTQCTSLNPVGGGSDDAAQIVTAISGCAAGTYVKLNSGTFTISSFMRIHPGTTSNHQNVSIRGNGPMNTFINMTGSLANIQLGASQQDSFAPFTSAGGNFTQGANSGVFTTSSPPSVGVLAFFSQCDTGVTQSGSSFAQSTTCTVGTPVDNGGLFVCAFDASCITSGGTTPHYNDQNQYVIVTSVSGSGSTRTIGFSNGLYMNNWSFGQGAQLNWLSTSTTGFGFGLEDLTVNYQTGASQQVIITGCVNCWVKGVRTVGAAQTGSINASSAKNYLIANNYIFAESSSPSSALIVCIDHGQESDGLVINNILTGCFPLEGEGFDTGSVVAYNFNRDTQTTYNQFEIEHHAESSLILHEGNQYPGHEDDDTWGTHHFNTDFRNYFQCWDAPYVTVTPTVRSIDIEDFARFENVVGNILGSSTCVTGYQTTPGNFGYPYVLSSATDPLATSSLMRWGNCDSSTNTCRFQSSEVPTTMTGNAIPFENTVPASNNLPCSFFLAGYTSTTCTPHANGGTGLSFWKVCTNYPTCNTFTTTPFPPNGPDVSGGTYTIGTGSANDIPATIAWKNLSVDTSYQGSFAITGSSFTGGIEKLTVTGLPNVMHLMGPMRISGGNCDTAGAEVYMTNSDATTVSYARGGSASCTTGNVLWPDVRQFDESVFQNDPAQTTTYSNVNGMVLRGVTSN